MFSSSHERILLVQLNPGFSTHCGQPDSTDMTHDRITSSFQASSILKTSWKCCFLGCLYSSISSFGLTENFKLFHLSHNQYLYPLFRHYKDLKYLNSTPTYVLVNLFFSYILIRLLKHKLKLFITILYCQWSFALATFFAFHSFCVSYIPYKITFFFPYGKYLLAFPLVDFGFPCGSAGKESAGKAGDPGSMPGLGRSPWKRERLPTPVFWSGEFHGLYSPRGCKESVMTERLSLHFT